MHAYDGTFPSLFDKTDADGDEVASDIDVRDDDASEEAAADFKRRVRDLRLTGDVMM